MLLGKNTHTHVWWPTYAIWRPSLPSRCCHQVQRAYDWRKAQTGGTGGEWKHPQGRKLHQWCDDLDGQLSGRVTMIALGWFWATLYYLGGNFSPVWEKVLSLSLSLSLWGDALYSRLLRHSSKEPHGKSCHVFMSCFVRKTGATPRTVSILNSKIKVWFRWVFFSIEWLLASKCEFSRVYLWWVLCDWVNGSAGGRGEGTQCTKIPRPCGHWFRLPHESGASRMGISQSRIGLLQHVQGFSK